jgi:hypothetical protein
MLAIICSSFFFFFCIRWYLGRFFVSIIKKKLMISSTLSFKLSSKLFLTDIKTYWVKKKKCTFWKFCLTMTYYQRHLCENFIPDRIRAKGSGHRYDDKCSQGSIILWDQNARIVTSYHSVMLNLRCTILNGPFIRYIKLHI